MTYINHKINAHTVFSNSSHFTRSREFNYIQTFTTAEHFDKTPLSAPALKIV